MGLRNSKRVLVCDHCLRACCWYGEFMCDDRGGAGLGVLQVETLKRLSREHPEYWTAQYFQKVYGETNPTFSAPDITAIAEEQMDPNQ